MRVLSVVGARPQFVKLAPLYRVLHGHEHVVVHTGQHYDPAMSADVFDDLGLPPPDMNLGVGSGSHADQTGRMLSGLERAVKFYTPDWVLVYGDTNSTLAGALAAVKLHTRVGHVEAGLRSGNRRMPEEHNRILTDHCADLLFAPTVTAMRNLDTEGLADRAVLTGDVAVDQWQAIPRHVDRATVVATIHRPENTDDPQRLDRILDVLRELDATVVAHPRLRRHNTLAGLRVLDPLPYSRMQGLLRNAWHVVTDSGGLQVEAFLNHTPCTTVRTETEWPETLVDGWNVLQPDPDELVKTVQRQPPDKAADWAPLGDGHAAERIVEALETR